MSTDRASRHFGLPTFRADAPGRSSDAELYRPRFRAVPPTAWHREVRHDERLDLMAYRTLGDPQRFWRLADANAVYDPLELLEPGRVLSVPDRS